MNQFNINVPDHEYAAALIVLPSLPSGTSVRAASKLLKMNENHLRFIIDELVKNKRLCKIETDSRPHHKRYKYAITKDEAEKRLGVIL